MCVIFVNVLEQLHPLYSLLHQPEIQATNHKSI